MMDALDSYNHGHNVLDLRNCSISAIRDLFQVLLHLDLVHAPEIWFAPLLHFGQGAAFRPKLYRWGSYPSSFHSFYRCVHRVQLIYKNYRTTVANFVCTSVINGSCLQHAFLLFDKLRTTKQVPRQVMLMYLVLTASIILPRGNSQTLGSSPCHALDPYI